MSNLVSIITPAYNAEAFIARTIESVMSQTHQDWELIIVNDGSTDNTANVVLNYSDPRLHYIYQDNQGLAGARNTGIRAARGKYMAFLDADDEWYPSFLERCVKEIEANPNPLLAGVYTSYVHIDQNNNILFQPASPVVKPHELYAQLLEDGFFPPHVVVVKTDIMHQVGLFDTQLVGRGCEDWDLWLRISARYHLKSIPEPLARYRIYSGSMSTNAEIMYTNRISVLSKHFGPPEGDPTIWSEEKQHVYGFAYRFAAFGYIQQGEQAKGWDFLEKAVSVYPNLLNRLDTFFELIYSKQNKGERGQAKLLDIKRSGAELFAKLDELFDRAAPAVQSMRRVTYGNTYLMLGMLGDEAELWPLARLYFLKAFQSNPRLVFSYPVIRRFLKLCIGPRFIHFRSWMVNRKSQKEQNQNVIASR